jgi:hypothetical protein
LWFFVVELKAELRRIDVDANGEMALLEYLLFQVPLPLPLTSIHYPFMIHPRRLASPVFVVLIDCCGFVMTVSSPRDGVLEQPARRW